LVVAPRHLLAAGNNDVIQKFSAKPQRNARHLHPGTMTSSSAATSAPTVRHHSETALHLTADGRRLLIIHGHELDTVVQNIRWLAFLGDVGYQFSSRLTAGERCPPHLWLRLLVAEQA